MNIKVDYENIRIAKVVGENEDGMTLFIPKDMEGKFHIENGDAFLTLVFTKQDPTTKVVRSWLPWIK